MKFSVVISRRNRRAASGHQEGCITQGEQGKTGALEAHPTGQVDETSRAWNAQGRDRAQAPWMPQPSSLNRNLRWARWVIAGSKAFIFTDLRARQARCEAHLFAYTTVSTYRRLRTLTLWTARQNPLCEGLAARSTGDRDGPEESGGRGGYNSGTLSAHLAETPQKSASLRQRCCQPT